MQVHNYNTVGNFIRFYEEFKKSNETHLESFFRKYHPLISADHHTCVGLSLELIKELSVLEEQYSGFIDKLFLVSCEECIDDIISYTSELPDPYDSEKEHVLLALKFSISDRCGILLLDPGYHIGRVITVMNDGDYPHTGWFEQSNENSCRKEYNYEFDFDNEDYVLWQVKENRSNNAVKFISNLIYVKVPYLAPVDVTERMNLVGEFKCVVSRNRVGRLKAGIYFPITKKGINQFTIFYTDGNITKREKMDFSIIENNNLTSMQQNLLKECNRQLGFSDNKLMKMLQCINVIIHNDNFIKQLLQISDDIDKLGQVEE